MNKRLLALVVLAAFVVVLVAGHYTPLPSTPEPPAVGSIEFKNPDQGVGPVVPGNPAYLQGDIVDVRIVIEAPKALMPGARYTVHEEFVNLWANEVYEENTWVLDPFDYPSGRVVLERRYDTLGIFGTREFEDEYAILVTITDSEGKGVSSAVAGFDIIEIA